MSARGPTMRKTGLPMLKGSWSLSSWGGWSLMWVFPDHVCNLVLGKAEFLSEFSQMRPEFTSDLLNCRCRETTLKISAQTHIITSILDHAGVDRPSSKDRFSRKSPNVHSAGWFKIKTSKKSFWTVLQLFLLFLNRPSSISSWWLTTKTGRQRWKQPKILKVNLNFVFCCHIRVWANINSLILSWLKESRLKLTSCSLVLVVEDLKVKQIG